MITPHERNISEALSSKIRFDKARLFAYNGNSNKNCAVAPGPVERENR